MIKSKIIPTQEFNVKNTNLSTIDIDRIIEMAWEDRTTFEAIEV